MNVNCDSVVKEKKKNPPHSGNIVGVNPTRLAPPLWDLLL